MFFWENKAQSSPLHYGVYLQIKREFYELQVVQIVGHKVKLFNIMAD